MPLDARRFDWSPAFPLWHEAIGMAMVAGSAFLFFHSYTDNPFLAPGSGPGTRASGWSRPVSTPGCATLFTSAGTLCSWARCCCSVRSGGSGRPGHDCSPDGPERGRGGHARPRARGLRRVRAAGPVPARPAALVGGQRSRRALTATITVEALISTAPAAGVSTIPAPERTPAASGIATTLYPVAQSRFWTIFR